MKYDIRQYNIRVESVASEMSLSEQCVIYITMSDTCTRWGNKGRWGHDKSVQNSRAISVAILNVVVARCLVISL